MTAEDVLVWGCWYCGILAPTFIVCHVYIRLLTYCWWWFVDDVVWGGGRLHSRHVIPSSWTVRTSCYDHQTQREADPRLQGTDGSLQEGWHRIMSMVPC